jgi:DNA-binding MarR family transcriptional regulator
MAERRVPAFRALLAYQINSTSEVLRRGAALRLRREHDVSLTEWRTLALIEHLQPVRLRDLAADFGADKAQISRIVTALVSRGLVVRRLREGDARSAQLELSDSGRAKTLALTRSAQDHDRAFRACLKPAEVDLLVGMLARVRTRAQDLLDEEERLQPGQASSR